MSSATKRSADRNADKLFTAEERAAMKERAREQRAAARRGRNAAEDGERDVLEKITEMGEPDRAMAQRLHSLIKDTAPELSARTWYGMPAYEKDGKIVCHFQPSEKFKTRYATLGFSDKANLDDGSMWPSGFALKKLTRTEEVRITELLKQAVS